MALEHSLVLLKDVRTITVLQITSYTLYYGGDIIEKGTIYIDQELDLITPKDGEYSLLLQAEGETDTTVSFFVYHNLVNSIIIDANALLCNCDSSANCGENCLSKAGKKCLEHKITYVKLIQYQAFYLTKYLPTYYTIFNNYLNFNLTTNNCNSQDSINSLLLQECIEGKVIHSGNLSKLQVALYYLGIYFIEKAIANGNQEQLEFIKQKFSYNNIIKCICDLCIDLDGLENTFTEDTESIYYWQFTDTISNINFAPSVNQDYLNDKLLVTETEAEQGTNYTNAYIGRVAFAITGKSQNYYNIYDFFGQDITSTVFDTYYNTDLNIQVYISKEYYSISELYLKLIPN
jgi:hypothetical protein